MFEALKAANAAKLTLSNMQGPASEDEHRRWSCTLLFYGVAVGSASGSDQNEFTVTLNEGLQAQIIDALQDKGFALDLSKVPPNSIRPDTDANWMRLAIAQIADERDLARELQTAARTQTLAVLSESPDKVLVLAVPFTQVVKDELQAKYGAGKIEFLNETLNDL